MGETMINRKTILRDVVFLMVGNLLVVSAVRFFILPFNILSGGVAGLAVALTPLLPFSIATDTLINIIILGTFVLGALFLGKKFAMKTMFSSIIYPIYLELLLLIEFDITLDPLLASLYAGIIFGVGLGLVFRTGASTGGMDIPPLIIHKFTGIKVATLVMIVDGLTILLGFTAYGLEAVLIGLISVFSTTYTINKVLVFGGIKAKTVFIISSYYLDILDEIHKRLDRGSTVIEATGGFTGDERPVILSVIFSNQYPQLQQLVQEIDPNAFLIVSDATEVKGEGFNTGYRI